MTEELANKLLGKLDSRQEQILQRNLDALLQVLVGEITTEIVDSEPVDRVVIHVRDEYRRVSHQHILCANIEMRGVTEASTKHQLIERAALRLKKAKSQDVTAFRSILADEVQKYITRKKTQYLVVFPFNVRWPMGSKGRRSVTVLGTRILVSSWPALTRRARVKSWYNDLKLFTRVEQRDPESLMKGIPFVIAIDARHEQEAFTSANERFELWRAALNIAGAAGVFHQQMGGSPRPIGRFRAPRSCGVFAASGEYKMFFYDHRYWPPPDPFGIEIPPDVLDGATGLLGHLTKPRSDQDIQGLILEGYRKLGAALDTDEWHQGFLELWQILELITCRDRSGTFRMDEVRDRAKRLLCEDPLKIDLLQAAYLTRNRYVHGGSFSDEGMLEFEMLESVVEYCLTVLSALRRICPTWHDLELFYSHAGYTYLISG